MKLRFDRGTILLTDPPQDLNLTEAPGVLWDPRVHAHRAPASRYTALKRWLLEGGVRFQDITPPLRPIAEAWSDVDLRPYQEAALSAWELAHHRGVVALPTGSGKTRLALAARRPRRATPAPGPASSSSSGRPSSSLPSLISPADSSPASTRSRCTSTSLPRNAPLTRAWLPCSTAPTRTSVGWRRRPVGRTSPATPLLPPRDGTPFRPGARFNGFFLSRIPRAGHWYRWCVATTCRR